MSEILWTKAHQGRVIHGFTNEFREALGKMNVFGESVERRTLCGKWFAYYYQGWAQAAYTSHVPYCKKCEQQAQRREE